MLGFLVLLINATVLSIPIGAVPFVYTAPLGGCAAFSAYVDPISPWGIASVSVVSYSGALSQPVFEPYPTPKYVKGRVCGDFVTIRIDKWRALPPAIPVSVKGEDSVYIYQGVPLEVNSTAIVRVKSFTEPQLEGAFYFKVSSLQALGVYIEEYVIYGPVKIYAYGIANITYINIGDKSPDFYVVVPTAGVRVEGIKPWVPDFTLWFSPNQTAAVGKPRVVVEQISIPVSGECNGSAWVTNPLERPLQVYVKLETGEEYSLSFYYIPNGLKTWRFKGASAKTIDGSDLPVYAVTTADGSPVAMCIVEGISYNVYVKVGDVMYRYPAEVKNGEVVAFTDLVKPSISLDVAGFNATVEPEVVKLGGNVTIRLYYNGTHVADYTTKAAPKIAVNASSLFKEMRVVDVLGTPIESFTVYVGGLKFRGSNGVVRLLPLSDFVAVEINGVKYLVNLQPVAKLPTLTRESFFKVLIAATAVGGAVAFGMRRKEGVGEGGRDRDVVEV